MATVLEKLEKFPEAEKQLLRGYTILSVSTGIHTRDCQAFLDEFLDFLLRRKDFNKAEDLASKNYDNIKNWDNGRNTMELAEVSARFGQLKLVQNKLNEAKTLVELCIKIREEKLGQSHIRTAHGLLQLANIYDKLGLEKYGAQLEAMLMRVVEIFAAAFGQGSKEVNSLLAQLRNVRTRRSALAMNSGSASTPRQQNAVGVVEDNVNDDEDDIDCYVTEESKPTTAMNGKSKDLDITKLVDELKKLSMVDGDADTRLIYAQQFFQQGKFSYAEAMLVEAYEILIKSEGEGGKRTQMAKQNLMLARQNSMNKLWMQIVTEELLDQVEVTQNGNSTADSVTEENGVSSEEQEYMKEFQRIQDRGSNDISFGGSASYSSGGCNIC